MTQEHHPSTADIARSGEAQGRSDESMRGRESVLEQKPSAPGEIVLRARPKTGPVRGQIELFDPGQLESKD
jgi:hypothetical protein